MSLVITNLQGEIQDRLEEAQYLREALNRTRESLECEQRLHSAAKTRKVKKCVQIEIVFNDKNVQ